MLRQAKKAKDVTKQRKIEKAQKYEGCRNVRELRNVVERAVALGRSAIIDAPDIWLSSVEPPSTPPLRTNEGFEAMSLDDVDKRHIFRTLEHTDWNKSQAATILNIERSTLDRKIKGYDLKR